MADEWRELTKLTGGRALEVERVRLAGTDIRVEGAFELPPLAALPAEDQVFVAAFVGVHGNIRRMEKLFGVSYPTIKGRLNRIAARLDLVEVGASSPSGEVLDRLESGEISVAEALALLESREVEP